MVFLVGRSTEVLQRYGMVAGGVVVLVGPAPPVWGSVFYRDMAWLLPLVSSNVIVTCSLRYKNMMLLFSPGRRCPCPCSDAVLRSCEEALAGIILHRPPSLWFAGPGARGPGPGAGEGGGRVGFRDPYYFVGRMSSRQG